MMNKFFFGLLLILFPILSFAADSSSSLSFTPPAGDSSVIYLGNIFGIVDGVLHGSGSQIMGAIFKVFNSAVLALGGIIVMYILLVSTMNTAHQGEMMGKWSSIWVPMRATIGLALLIPKASGYCMMQIFVMWIVVQGVGAADKVWEAALSYLNRGGTIIQASVNPAQVLVDAVKGTNEVPAAAGQILAGQVCMLSIQKQLEAQRDVYMVQKQTNQGPCVSPSANMQTICNTAVPDFISSVDITGVDPENPKPTVEMPGFTTDNPYSYLNGICGKIGWNKFDTGETLKGETEVINPKDNTVKTMGSTPIPLNSYEQSLISNSRTLAVQQMYLDLTMVARVMVNNDPTYTQQNSGTTNYSAVANQAFGLPYNKSGKICTTNTSAEGGDSGDAMTSNCNSWNSASKVTADGTENFGSLFSGTELQNSVADYNGIMMPTLTFIEQSKDTSGANKNRQFIANAKSTGWITAGSYFFKLMRLNESGVSNGKNVDSNTGLKTTAYSGAETLEDPFDDNGSCNSTSEFVNLCYWLGKDITKINQVTGLIEGNYKAGDIPAVTLKMGEVVDNIASSTVYGYLNNSTAIVLPGQPEGNTKFASYVDTKLNTKFSLKFDPGIKCKNYSLGGLGLKIKCPEKWVVKPLWKGIINFINQMLQLVLPMINAAIFTMVELPVRGMSVIFEHSINMLAEPGVNPIVAMAQMGTFFINFQGEVMLALMAINAGAAAGGPFGAVVWFLMIWGLPLIIGWMSMMSTIGFLTAYYIPFLPYLIFTFGSIAWLIAVIEAMVAAPIVALGITHPEGHEAFGKAEQGIMILMNVFLRPSMMIIGYIAGIALSYVGIWILTQGFNNAAIFLRDPQFVPEVQGIGSSAFLLGAKGGYTGWAGMFGYIAGVVMYVSMYVIIVQKAFSLISLLPDQILRWMGGQGENLGKEAGGWAEESRGKMEKAGEETEKGKSAISQHSAAALGKIGGAIAGNKAAGENEKQGDASAKGSMSTPEKQEGDDKK